MVFKYSIGATCACLLLASINASAAIISVDWKSTGDKLITRDTTSGLDWLDLTETNNMTYDFVSSQLDKGGVFEGFRYATNPEVITLWANFHVNLSSGAISANAIVDHNVLVASAYLGNIIHDGVLGYTSRNQSLHSYFRLGAYIYYAPNPATTTTTYYDTGTGYNPFLFSTSSTSSSYTGSYLVQASVIPVPSAIWLFGSGLIGLIGVARRKTA